MFAHILRLESLKQRHVALSLASILAATLILTLLRQLVAQQAIPEVRAGMFVLLSIVGIPLVAVLLAGSAGTALRSTSGRNVEEALPFHPRSTFLSAYLISLVHLTLLATPIVIGAFLTEAFSAIDALVDFKANEIALLISLVQLHALSFALSYISKLTIVGVASALAVCGLQLSLYFMPIEGQGLFWFKDMFMPAAFYFVAALSPFLFFTTVAFMAKDLHRDGRSPVTTILLLILFLFGGSFALFGQSLWYGKQFETLLNPAWALNRWYNHQTEDVLMRGAVFSTASGNLVRVRQSGEKVQLGKAPYPYGKVAYGPRNTVWVLTSDEASKAYSVRFENDQGLQDFTVFNAPDVEPEHLLIRGNDVYLFGTKEGQGQVYAILNQPKQKPVWQKNTWEKHYMERILEPLIEKGEAAYTSGNRKQLFRRTPDGSVQQWSLPGMAVAEALSFQENYYHPAHATPTGPEFFLRVLDSQSKQRMILCRADGSIVEPWPNARLDQFAKIQTRHLPGGGTAAVEFAAGSIYVLDAKGNAFPVLRIPPFSKDPLATFGFPRRLNGNHLWVTINSRRFLRFDLRNGSHQLLAEVAEKSWLSLNSAEEGIYFTHRGNIRLLEWNGNNRVVTSATFE